MLYIKQSSESETNGSRDVLCDTKTMGFICIFGL
jgi:hypothetical protein